LTNETYCSHSIDIPISPTKCEIPTAFGNGCSAHGEWASKQDNKVVLRVVVKDRNEKDDHEPYENDPDPQKPTKPPHAMSAGMIEGGEKMVETVEH
jgi:hypothetical protein